MKIIKLNTKTVILINGATEYQAFIERIFRQFVNQDFSVNYLDVSDSLNLSLLSDCLKYPNNWDFVILDSKGKNFARNVFEITKENNYNYIQFDYDVEYSITSKIDGIYSFNIGEDALFFVVDESNSFKIKHDKICVVADVHGCYEEFIEMLNDNKGIKVDGEKMTIEIINNSIDNGTYIHHVLIGDIIDKGPDSRKMIEFVFKNLQYFICVKGNHENFVYKYTKGKLDNSPNNKELAKNFFNTCVLLNGEEELKNKFFTIHDSMYSFVYNDDCIITHAPCKIKYLGKNTPKALKKMQTTIYPKQVDYALKSDFLKAQAEHFDFLKQEANEKDPIHIFGHVSISEVFRYKNKIGIDTGLVVGNKLTTVLLEGKNIVIKQYNSKQKINKKNELFELFPI